MRASRSISRGDYACTFFVETRWGSRLEFVLDNSERTYYDRYGRHRHVKTYAHGLDGVSYGELLWDMLTKEFARSKTIHVPNHCAYGDLSFVVHASSPRDLEHALERCDKVVARWVNKYRVNYMKES